MRLSVRQEGWFAVAAAVVVAYFGFVRPGVGIWVGVIALLIFAWHEFSKKERGVTANPERARMLELFHRGAEVTNDEVQRALNVSDATATRYLESLEREGLVVQMGRRGRHVFYKRK